MNQYNVKVGDYFIYLGETMNGGIVGFTHNKKYIITEVNKFNCYFDDDNGECIVSHLKNTYTDKGWLFVSKNEIRKQKLEELCSNQEIE